MCSQVSVIVSPAGGVSPKITLSEIEPQRHEDTEEHKVLFTKFIKTTYCVPPCLRAVVRFFIPESPQFNVNIQLAS